MWLAINTFLRFKVEATGVAIEKFISLGVGLTVLDRANGLVTAPYFASDNYARRLYALGAFRTTYFYKRRLRLEKLSLLYLELSRSHSWHFIF